MKTIDELRAELDRVLTELTEYRAAIKTENREADDDDVKHMQDLVVQADDIEVKIALEERVQQKFANGEKSQGKVQKTDPQERAAKEQRDSKTRFTSDGEFFGAVMRAGMPNGQTDPRLLPLVEMRAASGLNEAAPSDGGFLVQQDIAAGLLKNAFQTGVLASMCRQITISSNANSIKINGIDETSRASGSRLGGVRGYWADEADAFTASAPKFKKVTLSLNKLLGLAYVTDELMDDSAALGGIIRQAFAEEIGFQLDDAIINGSGAGQPLGILNGGSLVEASSESGQAATTLVYQNIINMWARLLASSRKDAVWLINQDVEPQLYQMSLAVGTGGAPVYLPAGGASAQPYSTLFGRPVIPIEQCQTLGTKGDIYLCDFKNGYILAQKGGVQTDMSIHVRFLYGENTFRFQMRIDGQPVLQEPITPYKGSNTLSHFVALEAR